MSLELLKIPYIHILHAPAPSAPPAASLSTLSIAKRGVTRDRWAAKNKY